MAGLWFLLATGALQGLPAKSGSPWILQATNFNKVKQPIKISCFKQIFFFAVCSGTSKSTWMCCATLIFCYEKGNTAQNIASPFDNNMYLKSDFRVNKIIIWTKDNVSLFHQLPCSIIWAGLRNKQNWHEHKAISVCHNCWCADKQQKCIIAFLY